MRRRRVDLTPEERATIEERRNRRVEQSQERLRQNEQHLAIMEERNRLRKEHMVREKVEQRARRIKAFLKTISPINIAKKAAILVTAIAGVIGALRVLSEYNPEARQLYINIITALNSAASKAIRGGSEGISKLQEVLSSIIRHVRRN